MKKLIAAIFIFASWPVNALIKFPIITIMKLITLIRDMHMKKNVSGMNIEKITFQEIQLLQVM